MSALDSALKYVAYGWHVFPCHSVLDGQCSCGNPSCGNAGKHPRTLRGVHDSSDDPEQVREWWRRWPDANPALDCGKSGLFVIDVDPRHDGFESLDNFEALRGDSLPQTLTSFTGSGGLHLFFEQREDLRARGRNPWLKGVDVKADGGYVMLPPSTHMSGNPYRWRHVAAPVGCPDDVLRSIIGEGDGTERAPLPASDDILAGVPEGARDDTFFRYACRLRRNGNTEAEALAIILHAAQNANPPFPEMDAARKVKQAFQDKYLEAEAARADLLACSDEGNARRFAQFFSNDARFVAGMSWLTWDETTRAWVRDTDGVRVLGMARRLPDFIRELEAQRDGLDAEDAERLVGWANRTETLSRLEAAVKLSRSDPLLLREADDFDSDRWLLNTPAGVLDLRTGRVRESRREDLMTRTVAWSVGDEESPRWNEFLERVQPDPELRAYLRRAVGYSLTGVTDEKCMFVLHGRGQNGKTVFLEVLRRLLKSYAGTAAKSVLVGRRDGTHPTDLAAIVGRRFVTCGEEIEKKDRVNAGLVKSLTGGDELTARFMRQDYFSFTPVCKLWLGTNYRPGLTDFGDAMRERLRLVPWEVVIPPEERRPRDEFMGELLSEADGILRWAVNGLLDWLDLGSLREPEVMRAARDEWFDDEDEFREFMEESVMTPLIDTQRGWATAADAAEAGWFTPSQDAHNAYREWFMLRGDDLKFALGKPAFARELSQRGVVRLKFRGVRGFVCQVRRMSSLGVNTATGEVLEDR